jgi:para-nitrobenzyl esterase
MVRKCCAELPTPIAGLTLGVTRPLNLIARLSASLGVLYALIAFQILSAEAIAEDHTVVKTQAGFVKGFVADQDVLEFLGIPYAKPPVGELRWTNPQLPDPWNGVRDATQYGKFCAQNQTLGDFAAPSTDEDCLYLNVFAPMNGQRRPVMFWIHGGGSVGQSNGYDSSALVREQHVVVVTINFRIGALGALVHPALDGDGATTLYTLRDQQFALKWVRDNIENFGGDPNNVTIFGESIGGVDIQLHMISPTAKGLFHKAIFESGPSRYFNRLVPLSEAEARGEAYATAVGCPDQTAACLRNLPVSTLLAHGSGSVSELVNDGHVLASSVFDAIRSGQFNRVPMLDVTNRDEYRWFVAFTEITTGHVLTAAEYPSQLIAQFGADAPAVQAAYPLSDFDSPSGALAAAEGDHNYPCQVRSFDVDASKYVRVYAAEFNDPNSPENVLPPVSFPYLAAHTHEIQYIFPGWKGASPNPATPLNPQQEDLAKDMRRLWGAFADKGVVPSNRGEGYDPRADENVPDLPHLTKDKELVISLEIPQIRVITDFNQVHRCDLWNSIRNWTPVP